MELSKSGKYMDEAEAWCLIQNLIEIGDYLQNLNIQHGDIRPHTILINRKGHYQLIDPTFMSNEDT